MRAIRFLTVFAMLVGGVALASPAVAAPHQAVRANSATASRTALILWYSDARGDNYLSGTAEGDANAQSAGYHYVRTEGYGLDSQQSGTTPLFLFWDDARGDNFTTATSEGVDAAYGAGYGVLRIEGYVYPAS